MDVGSNIEGTVDVPEESSPDDGSLRCEALCAPERFCKRDDRLRAERFAGEDVDVECACWVNGVADDIACFNKLNCRGALEVNFVPSAHPPQGFAVPFHFCFSTDFDEEFFDIRFGKEPRITSVQIDDEFYAERF